MPYRRSKRPYSATLKTALASKLSTQPRQGAWVHDHLTGETSYTADPARYLNNPIEHDGKPRFKVLWARRNRSARNEIDRKPRRPKPTLYPTAGGDPLADGRPTHAQTLRMDAKAANADPRLVYHLLNNVATTPADLNKAKALADYRAMAWFFNK